MKHSGGPLDNQTWQTAWNTAVLAKVQLFEYEHQTVEALLRPAVCMPESFTFRYCTWLEYKEGGRPEIYMLPVYTTWGAREKYYHQGRTCIFFVNVGFGKRNSLMMDSSSARAARAWSLVTSSVSLDSTIFNNWYISFIEGLNTCGTTPQWFGLISLYGSIEIVYFTHLYCLLLLMLLLLKRRICVTLNSMQIQRVL